MRQRQRGERVRSLTLDEKRRARLQPQAAALLHAAPLEALIAELHRRGFEAVEAPPPFELRLRGSLDDFAAGPLVERPEPIDRFGAPAPRGPRPRRSDYGIPKGAAVVLLAIASAAALAAQSAEYLVERLATCPLGASSVLSAPEAEAAIAECVSVRLVGPDAPVRLTPPPPSAVAGFTPGQGLQLFASGAPLPELRLDSRYVVTVGADVTEAGYKDLSLARLRGPTRAAEPLATECSAASTGEQQTRRDRGPRWCLEISPGSFAWRGLDFRGGPPSPLDGDDPAEPLCTPGALGCAPVEPAAEQLDEGRP